MREVQAKRPANETSLAGIIIRNLRRRLRGSHETVKNLRPGTTPRATDVLIDKEELRITPQIQQGDFDCGQTVLDMLGHEGHNMYPDQMVSSEHLRAIPGAKELELRIGSEEEIDYNYPKVWIILGGNEAAGEHWIIRHKDRIYCPTLGELDAAEYKRKYVGAVLQVFEIPVAGRQSPNEYYQDGRLPLEDIEKRAKKGVESSGSEQGRENWHLEYGSREWARRMANKTEHSADWWYNCAGAKGHRGEN